MINVQRVQLQPAYVIFQRPFRDTSALLELFTEAYGRRTVIARGIKRPGSKYRGLLQPFQLVLLSWVSKTELGTLADAELPSRVRPIHPKYLPSAFYLNELVHYLLHRDDPHEELFACYHSTLQELQQLSGKQEDELMCQASLRCFELVLLQSIGYGVNLEMDVDSQSSIEASANYRYIIDRGPVISPDNSRAGEGIQVTGATLQLLANIPMLRSAAQHGGNEARQRFKEAKVLLRSIIDYHLDHRHLHSRDMIATSVQT